MPGTAQPKQTAPTAAPAAMRRRWAARARLAEARALLADTRTLLERAELVKLRPRWLRPELN